MQNEFLNEIYRKATIKQDSTGIDTVQTDEYYEYIATRNQYLPDIISYLQNSTSLTRKTIVDILEKSETLYMFYTIILSSQVFSAF